MTDQELINIIGKAALDNWELFVSGSIGLVIGIATLSWMFSNAIHKREVRILQLQLSHHQNNFTQYQSIMEQRILVLQNEAVSLQEKFSPEHTELSISTNKESTYDDEKLDVPAFLRRQADDDATIAEPLSDYDTKNKIAVLIEKTDMVRNIINIASNVLH